MNRLSIKILLLFTLCIAFYSCQEKNYSPTRGAIKAAADESLFRVVSEGKKEFESLYVESKIELNESPARVGIPDLLEGRIQFYVCGRELNKDELGFIQKTKNADVKQYKFCYDGIVLVVKKNDKKENITVSELKDLLFGKNKNFKIFMPQFKSSTYEYIKSVQLEGKDPVNVTLLDSEKEVLEKVKITPNSIGLVALNVIADSSGLKFLKVGVEGSTLADIEYFEPHKGFFINGYYPLSKLSYIFTNEMVLSVAGGFATYLTGNEGQKLVLRQNLGPATVPVKLRQN